MKLRRGRRRGHRPGLVEAAPDAGQRDLLDPAGDLRLGRFAELEFVEHVAGDALVGVRVPEAGTVGARRREPLMAALHADRRRQRSETQVERNGRHFHARFLFLVGEGLPDAVARRIRGFGKPDFIVLVVGHAAPEADGVDRRARRAPFAFAQELGLARVDAGVVVFAVDSGNVIERIVLCHGEAEEAFVEDIGGARRPAVAVHRGVRLPAIEIARLRRVRRLRRIGRRQIGIARHAIVARRAAEGIGMEGEVSCRPHRAKPRRQGRRSRTSRNRETRR